MKNVVITGSTRGIGLAMAKEFLKSDCKVTISGRGDIIPKTVANKLLEFKNKYIYISCDVQNYENIQNLWDKSSEKWGTVDIWINNAGRNSPHEYCSNIDVCAIDGIINTNIKGMIYGSKLAAKKMLLQGGGQIWNMEGLGSNEMIVPKTILYGTTKRALTYFTKGLAKELKGTAVMASRLSPGMMLTDFITKDFEGVESKVLDDKSFKFIFNVLGDKPETVAKFFIPRILKNTRNDAHLVWLTNLKTFWRFLKIPFAKRNLI